MNRKFITIWLLIVLCTANPMRIELSDAHETVFNRSLEISSKLPLKSKLPLNNDNVMTHNAICPKSLPIYCVEKNTTKKMSRCYAEKYFKSWNDITQQEFILDDGMTNPNKFDIVTCNISNNLLDLTKNEFHIMRSLGGYDINNDPHETRKDSFQCILIGHQYEISVEEILYYTPQECNWMIEVKPWLSTAKGIENKTTFQKFERPVAGQMNYDFFSCSTTKEGILEAKKWYDNQKPWYQRWSKKVKEWYGKFWVVVIICIVGLCGIIVLCMYYCCCNRHAEQSEETDDHDESSVNDSNTHSVSKSDYVIEISELLSMQSTLTSITEPDKYSVETTNSITSKQSHLTASLSFSSAIELTNEMQVSKDSHDSESKTKVEESDDMHRLQFKNKAQEPKQKSDSNSESHFSI